MRILHVEPDRYDGDARDVLAGAGDVDYVECDGQDAFLDALRAAPYDAVVVRLGLAVDRAALDAAPRLRWIVTPTTGIDHVDVDEASRRGVTLVSLRGETEFLDTITPTAELTWALLLAVRRRLVAAHGDVVAGGWQRAPFVGDELSGRTLAIAGYGRLGRMVARYGVAFGMDVLVCDREPERLAALPQGVSAAGVDEIIEAADVLSLHLPLAPETAGFLSAARIRSMRPSSVLVNTARGELVDEVALLDALERGALAGAGLDVLAGDSRWHRRVPEDHPLVRYAATHDNLVLTPHIGGYARQAIERTRLFVARKFVAAAVPATTAS